MFQFFALNRSLCRKAVQLHVVIDRAVHLKWNDLVVKSKVSGLLFTVPSHSYPTTMQARRGRPFLRLWVLARLETRLPDFRRACGHTR